MKKLFTWLWLLFALFAASFGGAATAGQHESSVAYTETVLAVDGAKEQTVLPEARAGPVLLAGQGMGPGPGVKSYAGGGGTVSLDAFESGITTSGTTTPLGAFTVGAAANRALLCLTINDNNLAVNSIAYNTGSGGTWTKIGDNNNNPRRLEFWYSVAPASGSTNATVTWSGAIGGVDATFACYVLSGVDQTTPVDGCVNVASSTVTLSTTLTTGGIVMGGLLASSTPGAIVTGTQSLQSDSGSIVRVAYNQATGTVAYTTASVGRGGLICNGRAQ